LGWISMTTLSRSVSRPWVLASFRMKRPENFRKKASDGGSDTCGSQNPRNSSQESELSEKCRNISACIRALLWVIYALVSNHSGCKDPSGITITCNSCFVIALLSIKIQIGAGKNPASLFTHSTQPRGRQSPIKGNMPLKSKNIKPDGCWYLGY